MTATEAVKMQLETIISDQQAFRKGQKDAAEAAVIFKGLVEDENFQMMALAHADVIQLDPVHVALSLVYLGYMAAKLEVVANDIQN